jgi:hypothetical protein
MEIGYLKIYYQGKSFICFEMVGSLRLFSRDALIKWPSEENPAG